MARIVKSPAATADFEDIWLYSYEEWGEPQVDKYYDELLDGIESLADHPLLGQSRVEVRAGYRSLGINLQVVFYRTEGDVIDIIPALHQGMIPQKHL